MKIYTKKGDKGFTGLLFGGRVKKDTFRVELNGEVDNAQASLGFARAIAQGNPKLDALLISIERDLWVLMAEVATLPKNRSKLQSGSSLVTDAMTQRLENEIDEIMTQFDMPTDFVIPGSNLTSAALDLARTTIRKAERCSVAFVDKTDDSKVGVYLNRLSDLVWALARWVEGDRLLARNIESDDLN